MCVYDEIGGAVLFYLKQFGHSKRSLVPWKTLPVLAARASYADVVYGDRDV